MASATQISMAEYLETTYRPDLEYVDGVLRERNAGKREHARVQYLLGSWFGGHEREWGVFGMTEQRVQVAPDRVRIPDLVLTTTEEQGEVLVEPPVLAVEILSPDDTFASLHERCRDYREMGVRTVWIVDPRGRVGWMSDGTSWVEGQVLRVSGTPIFVDLDIIFSHIDVQL